MRLSKKILAGTVSAALLLGAPSAFAATSAQSGYSKPGGAVQTQIDNGSPPPSAEITQTPKAVTQTKSSGKLPFTGLDLVLVVAAGGILLALGFGMRRLSRTSGVA